MDTYRTNSGDTIDHLCWKHYGAQDQRIVEKVLAHNQGLAAHGLTYPPGITIELPDIEQEQTNDTVTLWD